MENVLSRLGLLVVGMAVALIGLTGPASGVAAAALECSEPKCLSGTQPAVTSWPGTVAVAINCPPPNPSVTTSISDC